MVDKDRNTSESEDGFFKLKPRTDVSTESRTNAAEPCKPPSKIKKEKKKGLKGTGKWLYWCYDDKHTVGCLLAIKDSKGKIL